MKMKKILLSSLATIALAASLASGATYALFTANDDVNIAITSGKVSVSASIKGVETFSGVYNSATGVYDIVESKVEGVFDNGGTATVNGKNVVLSNITPGDKAVVTVAIENKSNVSVFSRTIVGTDIDSLDLFEALEVTSVVDGNSEKLEHALAVSSWSKLETTGSEVKIELLLPIEAGNELQGLNCELFVVIEAIQANGIKTDANGNQIEVGNDFYAVAKNETELVNAVKNPQISHIKVLKGDYDTRLHIKRDLILFGADKDEVVIKDSTKHTHSNIIKKDAYENSKDYAGVIAVENAKLVISDLTIQGDVKNGKFYFDGQGLTGEKITPNYAGLVVLNSTLKANNLLIKDISTSTNGTGGAAICHGIYAFANVPNCILEVKNSTFTNWQRTGILVRPGVESINIVGNTFTGRGATDSIAQNGIQTAVKGVIMNNHFEGLKYLNVDPSEAGQSTGILLIRIAGGTLSKDDVLLVGNTFDMVDNYAAIYYYDNWPAGDNGVIIPGDYPYDSN